MEINNIDREVFAVAPVRCFKRGYVISKASGFFYEHKNELYFITNRHVVIDEDDGHYPEELHLKLHIDSTDLSKNRIYRIKLYDEDNDHLWLEHSKSNNRNNDLIDLVALPIPKDEVSNCCIKPFRDDKDLLPETEDLISNGVKGAITGYSIWERLFVIGYPEGHYDSAHNLPIFRSATLASAINVPFDGKPKCLIDSQLHKGTSGSPVIFRPKYYYDQYGYPNANFPDNGKNDTKYLLGIHSGEFDQQHSELGLHNVWFARLIRDIIKQNSDYFDSLGCKLEEE